MLGAQDSYEPICRHCFAELRKKSGNKRHLPVKIRTFPDRTLPKHTTRYVNPLRKRGLFFG